MTWRIKLFLITAGILCRSITGAMAQPTDSSVGLHLDAAESITINASMNLPSHHGAESGSWDLLLAFILGGGVLFLPLTGMAQFLQGDAVDVSEDFQPMEQVYFFADRLAEFDPATGQGALEWARHRRRANMDFNKNTRIFLRADSNEFPGTEYDQNPALPFSISFVSPRTVRLRFATRSMPLQDTPSLILAGDVPQDDSWKIEEDDNGATFTSACGIVRIAKQPWKIEFMDATGRLVTRTQNQGDFHSLTPPIPFSFIRRANDMGRSICANFQLTHDEKIFGCGESFTRFNKRGQRINVYPQDGMGVQTTRTYKPIPFFMSNEGYGMFVHTSAPLTFDFGREFDQAGMIYSGDETLDLFVFLGSPKEILEEYTALTGRSPVPPLWSFGLWMSRITYKSEEEAREVAAKLRKHEIPCDVIHLDTGWFETDWRCDYQFSSSRFDDPVKMIANLKEDGFRICLWQYPYFTSKNPLFDEIVKKSLCVRNAGGELPAEDAVLDFSNPETVKWYQEKLAGLLKQGVSAIKVDFGEEAPLVGLYASGRTGYYEHNLYPLRYNMAAAEIIKEVTGDSIIWARSAWAGSQRYPLHWGGDAENTDSAMAATLRAGLSFGLCGFTYWSHDAGGFVGRAPRGLYRRWIAFAALTSHTRCHGAPPREPWAYDEEFMDDFRRTMELKYTLMPYIYAQATASSAKGYPLLRALFFEFPDDPGAWQIDDEYMFGSDLLVAPLFDEGNSRKVYLPTGAWLNYQTGEVYAGAQWHTIDAGPVPIVLLVRDHSAIPHISLAQSTANMDWSQIELCVYSSDNAPAYSLFAMPGGELETLEVDADRDTPRLQSDPLADQVNWTISHFKKQ